MQCPQCHNSEMYPKRDDSAVNIGAAIGWLLGFIGLATFLFAPVVGLLMIIVAIVLGVAGRSSKTLLICPACRHSIRL